MEDGLCIQSSPLPSPRLMPNPNRGGLAGTLPERRRDARLDGALISFWKSSPTLFARMRLPCSSSAKLLVISVIARERETRA